MAQTRTAEVVIIGGGVTGASTAFHLTAARDSRRGRGRQGHARLRRHREELGLRAPALLHGRDLPDDPVLARLLPALRRARRAAGRAASGTRATCSGWTNKMRAPDGGLGRAPALDRHRHAARVAHRDARDRAAAAGGRLGGRLLRAGLGLLQPGRDRPGLRAGRPRGGRAHPGGHRGARPARRGRPRARRPTSRGRDIHAPVVRQCGGPVERAASAPWPASTCRSTCAVTRSASSRWPEAERRPHPMVYDFVTNIYTRPEMGEHILVGGLDAEESRDCGRPRRLREGVSLDESTDALSRVSHRFPVLADGQHRARLRRLLRRHAGLASHPRPRRPRGLSRGRRLLRPRLQAVAGGGPHDGHTHHRGSRAAIPTCPPSGFRGSQRASRSEALTATG